MSMFEHRRVKALTCAIAAGVLLAASAAHAQTTLRYSPWLPAKYPLNDAVLKPWMAEVEKVTEGRVKFDWLPKAVGSAPAQFDTVRDGLADLSLVLPGYTPGRFELIELGELPLLSSDVSKLGPIFYKLYAQHLEPLKPFAGTHVLSIWATIPTHVVSAKGIVRQLDDFKGLKLRAPSATAVAVMKQVGAVPVQKPVSEIYELASTGIIDGSFFPISTTYDFKVDKALKYMTLVPGGLGQSVMALLVNESKWKKISEKDRTAIMALSGERIAGAAGVLFGKAEADAIAKAKAERPDEVAVAGTALMKDLTKALEPVDEDWFKKAKAKKLANPEKVLESFRAELAK
ncbi:MAG: TRAP transporter substrate-binding protein [Lautropia sp.]